MSHRTLASSARTRRGRPAPVDGQPAASARAARRPGLLLAAGVALVSLAAHLRASRGAELGTPAGDDYDDLHALRFERPLDLLGPMQTLWYWRPLSRQAYYALFDPLFFTAPGVVAAAHVTLLLVLYVLAFRTARRWLSPLAAAALAVFPLLAEPTRALVAWPTAAQPLLAMVFVTLTLHEAAARRLATAGAALLAAFLCHEQALLAAPAVPILLALDARREFRRGLLVTAAAVLAYGVLRVAALGHGAGVPERIAPALALAGAPDIVLRSAAAQLGAFPALKGAGALVPWAEAALLAGALAVFAKSTEARRRLRRATPALGLGGAWFVLGVLPMAFAPELWTPRHSCLPGLGLGLLVTGLLACAHPALAMGLATVRLGALLLAPTVPALLPPDPVPAATPFSFLHVTRLQRTADSARLALVSEHPTLPRGTAVRYWSLPHGTEIAFAGPRAVRVWYADSTLSWSFWNRFEPDDEPVKGPVLGFNTDVSEPAVLMRPEAVEWYEMAFRVWSRDDHRAAEVALERARRAQAPVVAGFTAEIVRLQARLTFARGAYAEADSLNRLDREIGGESASYFAMRAMLALQAGDLAGAAGAVERCLALRPDDFEALTVAEALRAGAPRINPERGDAESGSRTGL